MVRQVAELLHVDLAGATSSSSSKRRFRDDDHDDLLLSTGPSAAAGSPPPQGQTEEEPLLASDDKHHHHALFAAGNRIASKYADKLRRRGLEGGLAAVELAKHQVQDTTTTTTTTTLSRGDAAGHLAARKIAAAAGSSSSKSSWMAMTGTGALLQYLTQRSIKIVLLPSRPSFDDDDGDKAMDPRPLNEQEGERMEEFTRQLNSVAFEALLKDGRLGPTKLVQSSLQKLKMDPNLVLLVSDRDDYLRAAKEASFLTCRILAPNARRGNISAHYRVASIPEVQEVVNEVNGISFNAVLKKG